MLLNVDDLFIADFIETATVAGTAKDCIRTAPVTIEEQYTKFGSDENIDLILCFKRSAFTILPARGTAVVYDGKTYQVIRTAESSDGGMVDIAMVNAYEN